MAIPTTNYGLIKPSLTDNVNISVINSNMDVIDNKFKSIDEQISEKIGKKVRYYSLAEVTAGASPNYILDGSFLISAPDNPIPNVFFYYEQYFYSEISATANRVQYVTTYNSIPIRNFIREYINGIWYVKEIADGTDTGWIDLALNSGFTASTNSYTVCKIRKIGNQVFIKGHATATITASSTVAICTIPSGFRPAYEVNRCQLTTNDTTLGFYITNAGTLNAWNRSTTTLSNVEIDLSAIGSWLID